MDGPLGQESRLLPLQKKPPRQQQPNRRSPAQVAGPAWAVRLQLPGVASAAQRDGASW